MITETLKDLSQNPFRIRIFGKSLLYKVDLQAQLAKNEDSMHFEASGEIRFGVLKSDIQVSSKYQVEDETFLFREHRLDVPKVKFLESYFFAEEKLIYSDGKKPPKAIESFEGPLMDPLPLIFKLAGLQDGENVDFSGFLLSGGRQKAFRFKKTGKEYDVFLSEKKLFGGKTESGTVQVTIPKFKVSLEISKL